MRKQLFTLLTSICFSSLTATAQSISEKLRVIEHSRLRSLVEADMITADSLHADDFQLINPSGGKLSKQQYLGAIASGEVDYLLWNPDTIEVRVLGNAAILRYQAEIKIKVKSTPDAPEGKFWHTDLYELRNGQWKVVWSQATQIRQ
jgi:hypothetical protein